MNIEFLRLGNLMKVEDKIWWSSWKTNIIAKKTEPIILWGRLIQRPQ